MRLEDLAYLCRRECIETAAEGTQLDQRNIRMLRNELCRMIKTCMITPLIDNLQTPFADRHVVYCILGENRQLIGLDHLGDAVIDLGINMIGTTR